MSDSIRDSFHFAVDLFRHDDAKKVELASDVVNSLVRRFLVVPAIRVTVNESTQEIFPVIPLDLFEQLTTN
jgi:hypothetical protein